MDYKAIARAITDPENQPHQWNDQDLAQFFVSAAEKIEDLEREVHLHKQRCELWKENNIEAHDEIKRLQQTVSMLSGDRDLYIEEIKQKNAEIERLREALHMWDYLIEHQYTGSREAMSDMMDAAQHTARLLYGDPPWPSPRPALQQKDSE